MTIYQWYEIREDRVEIKFHDTLDTTTLTNSHFTLTNTTTATPASVANPFQTIVLTRDYFSVARTLYLYWNNAILNSNSSYSLSITGLKNSIGSTLTTEVITFTTGTLNQPVVSVTPPTRVPTDVEDYSLKDTAGLFPDSIISTSDTFYVESIKPDFETAFYLDPSYNEGKIEIIFNAIPAANFVSDEFFKVQRKLITKGIQRWENVSILVTSSPENNLVVIYMPSDDATPLYGEPNKVYWVTGYKYRLRISGNIGI
jgi:hypothetical protein